MARDGRWRAGTRLPGERELSEMLGTSRPTLRKILGRFEQRGALSRRRRGGTFVLEELDPALLGEGPSAQVVSFVGPMSGDAEYSGRQRFLQDELIKSGFVLNAYLSSRDFQDPEKEWRYLRSLFKVRPAGLVIIATPKGGTNAALLSELSAAGIKVVHLDHYRAELPAEPFVMPDWRLAGTRAAAFLRMRGAINLAVANPGGDSPAAGRILEGIASTADVLGVKMLDLGINCVSGDRSSARLKKALAALPVNTGIIATHREAAAMLVEGLMRTGGAPAAARRVVGVHEYDEGFDPPPATAAFVFSWEGRARTAIEYITDRNRKEGPRLLLEPRFARIGKAT